MAAPVPTFAAAPSKQPGAVTSHPITLPAGMAVGEGCIPWIVVDGSPTVTWPAGWTKIADVLVADNVTLSAAKRTLDGTEGATVTVTTSVATRSIGHAQYIVGGDLDALAFATIVESGNVTSINPAAVSGLPLGDFLASVLVASDQWKSGAWTFPANYVNTGRDTSADANLNVTTAWATRQLTGITSEDPGVFSHPNSADQMVALTLLIPEAATSPAITADAGSYPANGGGDITITADPAFAAAISEAAVKGEPRNASIQAGATGALAVLDAFSIEEFMPGGVLNGAGPFETPLDLLAGDGTDTATVQISILPEVATRGGIITKLGPKHPAGAQIGDYCYVQIDEGDAFVSPETGQEVITQFPYRRRWMVYRATSWIVQGFQEGSIDADISGFEVEATGESTPDQRGTADAEISGFEVEASAGVYAAATVDAGITGFETVFEARSEVGAGLEPDYLFVVR